MTCASLRLDDFAAEPAVRGFLHEPLHPAGDGIVLAHGAGATCESILLQEMASAFAAGGWAALRINLPFRQMRPHGPPSPGGAERDREGLRRAVSVIRSKVPGRIFLGGHSYGGRQATLLVSGEPQAADGLLLLSYPLHPPKKPDQLRTGHFPKLTKPAFFVHGTRDPFGTIEEMRSALALIPAPHAMLQVEGADHGLAPKKGVAEWCARVAQEFQTFIDGDIARGAAGRGSSATAAR